MGIFSSKPYLTDGSTFATKVDREDPVPLSDIDALKEYHAYDYIIVGAGAAGCVLASRLSEDANVSVLLVEAGADHADSPFAHIPAAFSKQFKTSFDWAYYTTPQANLNDRKLFQPRGKMLGGSTYALIKAINAMMYHLCSPSDFEEWERLGAKGWGYQDLAPFFRSSEKFTPHLSYPGVKTEERGSSGLWHTGYTYCSEICKQSLLALTEVGIPLNPDVNTPRGSLGATKIVTFIDPNGRRSSTATAYLSKEVVARKNLTIAIKTTTTRIIFSTEDVPRALGVEVANGESSPYFRVSARKEVILAAGSLNTPQVLNLSGIGAKDELDKFGIKVVKDLPAVGKNLSDHLTTGSVTFRSKSAYSLAYMYSTIKSLPAVIYWLITGKGPASTNLAEVVAFVRSQDPSINFESKLSEAVELEDTTSGVDSPDLELITAPISFLEHGFRNIPAGTHAFSVLATLLRPLSTGTVSISSASPFDKAVIDPKYLTNPNDLKVLLRGARLILRIGRTNALRSYLDLKPQSSDKTDVFWPGDADPDQISDNDLIEFIKSNAETLYHPIGTAKIGLDDKDSVVGPDLKVHGVQGLRIVDASIFPSQISGHTTATVIAIAEKAAIMIAKAYL